MPNLDRSYRIIYFPSLPSVGGSNALNVYKAGDVGAARNL